ncbi:uncharacterized protein BDZ99DRAFT_468459 [Mytilinidion resinicola]|uniref:Ubiquitin-like domain-containing protein n=1 Tax=Mytilinidion resinicola TaxID=574789 RepID=A0A6A6Y2Q9_9PEZI|nr:uncharacterized protein BDZ99DRAFT_468459 [Mytilinidion resinicola]KAF2803116.1 hypothetical protein BDZ99DRAFT_468459 [Mytilinidion resinicola]
MSETNDTYSALQVEAIDGSEVVSVTGMARFTTVKTFKRMLATKIRCDPSNLRLMAFGRPMEDASTLGDCGIEEDTIITRIVTGSSTPSDNSSAFKEPKVRPAPTAQTTNTPSDHPSQLREKYSGPQLKTLFIKNLDGKSLTVHDIPLQMPVCEFVVYFAHEKGLDSEGIRLLFGGKELNEKSEHMLMDYGIMNGSELRLVYRLKGGL